MNNLLSAKKNTTFKKILKPLIFIALCVLIPTMMEHNIIFKQDKYIYLLLCFMTIYAIATSGLDLLFGYTGQISFGHAGFFAIGSYSSVLMSHPAWGFAKWFGFTLPPIITIFIAAILSMIVGILLSLPASKLVFHFLSLLTIAFGQLIFLTLTSFPDITNSYRGITAIPQIQIFGLSFNAVSNKYSFYLLSLFFLVIFLIIKQNIVKSRVGRGFTAIRENVLAANGCGIDIHYYKMMAFGISAFYTGFAGALYAHMIGFISPDTYVANTSNIMMTMLLFGGNGNLAGPVVGAAVITLIQEGLQNLKDYRMLIFGIFLLIVILFQPNGVYGLYTNIVTSFKKKRGAKKNAEA